jgi:Fe-S-cluster containining protein
VTIFGSKPPWYIAGLAFDCGQCGRCCAGPDEGYVWISDSEIELLAQFLGATVEQVRRRNIRRVGRRQTIIEDDATRDCMFLSARPLENGQCRKGCSIYEARPTQCRTWPFWPINLSSPEAWSQAAQRCPGINRGNIHSFHEIETKRQATES